MTDNFEGPPRPTSFSAGPRNDVHRTPGLPQSSQHAPASTSAQYQPAHNGGGHDAPSRTMTVRAQASTLDARGRSIAARKLSLLDYYRLTKMLGEQASNERQMELASLAASVTEIDGEPTIFPNSEREIEALLQRLDFDGITDAGEALKTLNPPAAPADTAKN